MLQFGPALLFVVVACATTEIPSTRETSGIAADLITRAELRATNASNAYMAIRRAAPHFLRPHTPTPGRRQGSTAIVYIDGVRYGSLRTLQSINVLDVNEIQYLDGPEATIRFGTGHPGGAILVKTRSGGINGAARAMVSIERIP